MAEFIEFTDNYEDQSTERGFQWEFRCQRCGNGYRSQFKTSTTGVASGALDLAGNLLGGIFGSAAQIGSSVHSAAWERDHDANFAAAAREVKPFFVQCPRCNNWVCRRRCWNESRSLCYECAPDVRSEVAAAQAEALVEQARQKVAERTYDVSDHVKGDNIQASCPECGAKMDSGVKFCPECGHKLEAGRFCMECGAAIKASAKFCPECGKKV
jgi:membrane protease subunit (stomatin/prohibitin family)